MRTEDLKILFKNTTFKAEDIKTYIIDLLNKFEVALLWNNQNLLIPSLLPTEMDMRREQPGCTVRVSERGTNVLTGLPLVREKSGKFKFREKSRNFVLGQGNLRF